MRHHHVSQHRKGTSGAEKLRHVETFANVVTELGTKPDLKASQNAKRRYSEEFSRLTALWLKRQVEDKFGNLKVLYPEAKVDTVEGEGVNGKSLDVAALTASGYLAIDFSIKTFNFKDVKTSNYRKNFTGRFYELLGEELVIRKSYDSAVKVALILLPSDAQFDGNPSSFALAVKQFRKAVKPAPNASEFGFEFVFIGIHNAAGISFFDALRAPPKSGVPGDHELLSSGAMLDRVKSLYQTREPRLVAAELPRCIPFEYAA